MDSDMIFRWMKGVPFFKGFPDQELTVLAKEDQKFLSFDPGENIIREGQKDQCVFIILKGTVAISKSSSSKDVLLTKMNAGAVFGELSILRKGTRTSSVVAEKKTVVMAIKPEVLENMEIHIRSKFKDELLKIVLKRFETINDKYTELLSEKTDLI